MWLAIKCNRSREWEGRKALGLQYLGNLVTGKTQVARNIKEFQMSPESPVGATARLPLTKPGAAEEPVCGKEDNTWICEIGRGGTTQVKLS